MVNHILDDQQESEQITLVFSIKDTVDGVPVNTEHISVAMLGEFVKQVTDFIKGSRRIDVKKINAAVKNGSLTVEVTAPSAYLADAAADYRIATSSDDISDLDPIRRRVITVWQNLAKTNEGRTYTLSLARDASKAIVISGESAYHVTNNVWVTVEKYVYGEVSDIGGRARPNVHIVLENGRTITIAAERKLLASDRQNRIYHNQLLRIEALQNIYTEALKDERLLGYELYNPHYDESLLEEVQANAAPEWATVSPSDWVEAIRGNV